MKIINKFYNGLIILLTGIFLSSCANVNFVKRKYMPGYYVNKSLKIETVDNEIRYLSLRENKEIFSDISKNFENHHCDTERSKGEAICSPMRLLRSFLPRNDACVFFRNVSLFSPDIYFEECDEIILMNGDIIKVKVTEIGIQEIIYRECDNLDGPDISILRADVFMIKYANGTKELFNTGESKAGYSNKSDTRKVTTDGYAIASLVTGITGILFYFLGIILGMLGVIFGVISIRRIEKDPDKYKGRGMAVAGIVTGAIAIILFLFILFLILNSGSLF